MAANILNSPRAVAMSVYVIRAFVNMRGELAANAAILKRLAEIDKTLLIHDVALREIFEKLRPLLAPPPPPPKPEIGFHVKEDAVPYTAPISEQRPKVATNGRGSGFCRAQPAENMTISWTEPFQKQVGPRQSRKAKMLRSVGYDPVTLPSKAAKNLALSRLRACSWPG